MHLPSLQKLTQAAKEVAMRFPLELFCAAIGTGAALWLVDHENADTNITRLLLCAILGLVLFLSATIFAESRALANKQRSLLHVLVVLVLVACWFAIIPIQAETSMMRYGMFFVAFHLLVACAPKTSAAGFWEYNKQLFLRILLSGLYSAVLFAGLCIAIASTNFLFKLNIDDRIYARLWIVTAGLFNTTFFLAGVPRTFKQLAVAYPIGLKVFTQYVLIPLATVYLAIILTYEANVLAQWSLPDGIIAWLILGYAVYGILSTLLVYPVRLQEENKWISTYSKWFYYLLVPLLPLLGVAIGIRIGDYGITELRYSVVVLALWLAGITVYFLLSKNQNIKLIPLTLAMVVLLSAWGPQSASSVSKLSQVNRLQKLFVHQGSVENGTLKQLPPTVSDSIGNEAVEQLRFLNDRYGTESLIPLLPLPLRDSLLRTDTIKSKYTKRYQAFEIMRKGLGLKTYYSTPRNTLEEYYKAISTKQSVPVSDFQFIKPVDVYPTKDTTGEWVLTKEQVKWTTTSDTLQFTLSVLLNELEAVARNTNTTYLSDIPQATMTIPSSEGSHTLVLLEVSFNRNTKGRTLTEIHGLLLFKSSEK
jgi:hypothetical protein